MPADTSGPTDVSRDLAALLPDPIVVVDADAQVVWGNRAAERMFDRRLEDSVGFPALDLVHPDDVGLALVCMESIQGRDAGSPIELRVRTADGWRLVELVGASLGEQVALTLRDLTVRRRWEIAKGDDNLFRSVLQNAAAVMVLLDADWRVVATTAAVTRAYGWDPEALEGVAFSSLLAPASRSAVDVLDDS
ncbi:MAG: PAS domain-containing protein, partial [Acidobacteria bacterium]|nr:PAS domain-containing protein [Acidobacteriota bacterium]